LLKTDAIFVVAQEFFDALPINLFEFTDAGWREILVDIDESQRLVAGFLPGQSLGWGKPKGQRMQPFTFSFFFTGIVQRTSFQICYCAPSHSPL
jgi:NADH dehydrogenase [ubiquinone] 1 alpha subcomplex assembly factor 7